MGFKYLLGKAGPSGFGSKATAEKVSEGISLDGRTILITGATAGIGVETARVLALRGATVVIAARNLKKAEDVKAGILKEIPSAKVEVRELDVGSFASVRKFAEAWKSENRPLHILINNAGIVAGKFQLSVDGHESMFSTNHLGHFLLTNLLLDNIVNTAKESGLEGRIVIVSSSTHKLVKGDKIVFEDIDNPKKFSARLPSYGLTKLANMLHANELSRRLQQRGANVTVNSLHPGVIGTNLSVDMMGPTFLKIFQGLGKPFMKTVPQGAATTVFVATSPALNGVTGKYFADCNVLETKTKLSKDEKAAADLWEYSEKVTALAA